MAKQLGDIQSHVNPVRVRVRGEGNLQAFLFDEGTVTNSELDAKAMSLTSAQSINYLSNFTGERICLQLIITEMDEYFVISNIWAYTKPSRNSFPQT